MAATPAIAASVQSVVPHRPRPTGVADPVSAAGVVPLCVVHLWAHGWGVTAAEAARECAEVYSYDLAILRVLQSLDAHVRARAV